MGFEVAGVELGGERAWVIAELGHNHGGDVDLAAQMVDQAALAGADAVKLQVRDNASLYTKAFYDRPYDSENSFGPTYGAHRQALELSRQELAEIRDAAKSRGLACFATAFDRASVDTCVELGFPAIKIASACLTNIPLLTYAARTGLAIFCSTGGATIEDVDRAVEAVWACNHRLCVMQATASYPCDWDELDLAVVGSYLHRYPQCVIGLSSHANGIAEGPAAYVLGARVFEKHFTLDHTSKGTDHAFSLQPQGLRSFVRDMRRCEVMIGDGIKRRHFSEAEPIAKMSQSVYAARPLAAGRVLSIDDLCVKSPGAYIPPYELPGLLGKEVLCDLQAETPISWEVVADHVVGAKRCV